MITLTSRWPRTRLDERYHDEKHVHDLHMNVADFDGGPVGELHSVSSEVRE